MMTKISRHPVLKKLRLKFVIEASLLFIFLVFYNDGFDGAEKPLWANIVLIAGALLFIGNDVAGYFMFQKPVMGKDIGTSLKKFSRNLKRLAISSVSSAFLFGCAMIIFFSTVIDFTPIKLTLMAGMFLAMMVGLYLSYKNWSRRIGDLNGVIEQLNG
jgi:hypothetical protein